MLSIIIPTFNRHGSLSQCLGMLFTENPTILNNCEVIVTDDSTNNSTMQLIARFYPFVQWIKGPQKGPAANRNNGAKGAKGEWLLFLDDDCLPQKEWFRSYDNAIKLSDNKMVFEGSTLPDRGKQRFDEEAVVNRRGNNLYSCNFAINRSLFEQLGGFDERFPFAAMEDLDFCRRVSGKTQISFLPEALVLHPWRRIEPFKTFKKHLKSHQLFAEKHQLLNLDYRWNRTKIFVGRMFYGFLQLVAFSFRGWKIYIEKCILNFFLIFI